MVYFPQEKLFEAILLLRTLDECALFFGDLLALEELAGTSTGSQIILELSAGKKVRQIAKRLRVSSDSWVRTLNFVQLCL